MKLLNLGCGHKFHEDWINIDFVSTNDSVLEHNLLNGIPLINNSIDVVYHSHVLEHFSKEDGLCFIQECFRVLRKNGIIRIAVPDLEAIAREYLRNLQLATTGDIDAKSNYEWIILELFDQMVRDKSGGNMKNYLNQVKIPNESYIFERIGVEGKAIRKAYLNKQYLAENTSKLVNPPKSILRQKFSILKRTIVRIKGSLFKKRLTSEQSRMLQIGQFRLGGEIHQWMYDRYSLSELLTKVGFKEIKICNAFESKIESWELYQLDTVDGEVRKPDSIFIEARKL